MANRLHKVIFSYINCLEFTFPVIMWRPLCQTDGTVVLNCFQFRLSLVAVCFVGLFTGRSVRYNNFADRVVYNCDSILLFEERPNCGKTFQRISAGVHASESGLMQCYNEDCDMCDECAKDEEWYTC